MRSLDLSSPLVAAPMAGGPTSPELLRAVADAGSLGFLPAAYRTAAQLADDRAEVRRHVAVLGV
jgi:NAD(P)H-dependent flavin oxidoreductase YrpB (nitropropane dioxygenase family)